MSYSEIYYLCYFIVLILLLPFLTRSFKHKQATFSLIISITLILSACLYFTFRGYNGPDTGEYYRRFLNADWHRSLSSYLAYYGYNSPLFYMVLYALRPIGSLPVFFFIISVLYFLGYFLLADKLYPNSRLLFTLLILGLFITFNVNTNIIKTGISVGLFLLFLYYSQRHLSIRWLFFMLAILFHPPIVILLAAYFCSKWIKKTWIYLLVLVLSLGLAIADIGVLNIPGINHLVGDIPRFNFYLNKKNPYQTGFRLDFTVFNLFFAALGWIAYRKKEIPFYYRMYLCLTALFMLWYALPGSDRVGLYSWLFIPFVIMDFSKQKWLTNQNLTLPVLYSFCILLGGLSAYLVLK